MSDYVARSILSRIHLREMAVAAHYTGLANDIRMLSGESVERAEAAAVARRTEMLTAYGLAPMEQRKPFAFSSGIAVIPVHGTLVNRFGYSWGYLTGYNFIRQQVAAAGQDPDVLGIVFDMNSYGGEAAGCFECSDDIKRLAGGKPTLSVIDSNCYSACYALASGTDRIVSTPSGGAGSIGVVAMHVSMEKMLDDIGVKVTFIHAGKHKIDGNPYEDLPDDVRADMQKSIDKSYAAFVGLVAKGRGMDEKAVRATEARIYRAEDAMSLGLIDAVMTPQAAVTAFLGELSGSNPQPRKKEDAMSDGTKPGATNTATPEEVAKAQADAKRAERARVSGIMGCEEAKGREALANHIAMNTEMSVDEAKAMLALAPKTETPAASAGNGFKAAMDTGKHPNVGADNEAGAEGGDKPNRVAALLRNASEFGVRGFSKPDAKRD
jgi:signal peptide peptidase SppA